MLFFNPKDAGPMVLEKPPADGGSIVGSIMDCWQIALEDVSPADVEELVKSFGSGFIPDSYPISSNRFA